MSVIHGGESSTARIRLGCSVPCHVGRPVSVGWPGYRLRLDVVADFREEGWPSMDLTAEMLADAGARLPGVQCQLIRPPLWRTSRGAASPTAMERAAGRFIQYPMRLVLRERHGQYFHIADHSYAHLVHLLPTDRVGVYCHDIDAFRALLPGSFSSPARRVMARCILSGLRRAAVVFHSTEVIRDALVSSGLVPAARLVHAPYGTAPEFTPQPGVEDSVLRARVAAPFVLHVGSCIPRKNTGFLLHLLARLRRARPDLHLIQVGGHWPEDQRRSITELGLDGAVHQLRDVSRLELAALYRNAEAVLLPSRSEGFGLPLLEGLACAAKVVATDLRVFREVGGDAAEYARQDDLEDWAHALVQWASRPPAAHAERCARQAARYSWNEHARRIVLAYTGLFAPKGSPSL
jgi:glycosyltransferase involved in cell wall biosynthesis